MTRVLVVGAGFSGLAVAHFLKRGGATVEVRDGAGHAGGNLRTSTRDGWLVEWGANGFVDNEPSTIELAHDLEVPLVRAAPKHTTRFVVVDKRLVPVPTRPQQVLTSSLLSVGGKVRFLREGQVVPHRDEESVARFAARRFGPEAVDLADALVTGVYAGDPQHLSIDYAFPEVRRMEREHGSVLRAMRGRRTRGAKPALSAPEAGMQAFVSALAHEVAPKLGARVGPSDLDGWDHVVLAIPPNSARALLDESEATWPTQRSARIAVVALGFPGKRAEIATKGFGYLAAEKERRLALGAVFESAVFPSRAPDGHVLIRALVGGVRHPDRVELPDEALVAGVRDDLAHLGVASGAPVFSEVVRPPGGIPQLEVGHARLLAAREAAESKRRGLHLVGAGWSGVSLNGLAREAKAVAENIVASP